jgi:hypothetical protein
MRKTLNSVDFPNPWEVSRPGVCNFGGGSNTSTTSNQMDPWLKGILSSNTARAEGIANRPFEGYGGQGYAPLSQNQRTAMTGAQNLNGAGAPAIDMGINAAGGFLNGSAASGMANWQNPYTEQVVNSSLNDIERQRKMAIGSGQDAAIAAKAYGGSRHGVADSLTNENFARVSADTAGRLRDQGFNTSAQMAQQDAGRGIQAAGLLGNLGQQQFNNGLGYVNALTQTGAMEQQTQQGQNAFDYQEFMRRMGYPQQGQQLINQSLGLLPSGGTTTTTGPNNSGANTINGILGIGQTAASLGWNPFG